MKKLNITLFAFLLLGLGLCISSCDDEDGSLSLAPLIEHKGIYIDSFLYNGTLGNNTKEDALLNWCDEHDFTEVYLYNVGAILSAGHESELDAFVLKAHNMEPRINVTFVSAGFGTSFANIENYHDMYTNEPDGIVSEIEFWNGSLNYTADYLPWINRLDSLKFAMPEAGEPIRNPDVIKRFYIGKVKDGGGSPSLAIAKELVKHHDEIFLANYHTNAYELSASEEPNSIKNRLRLLAQAGMELNKEVTIVILFNVFQDSPSPHIWDYFSDADGDHSFEDAYVEWHGDFEDAADIDNKEFLKIKGYGIYRHTDARVAKP